MKTRWEGKSPPSPSPPWTDVYAYTDELPANVVLFSPRAELIEVASDSWTSDEEGFALALSWPRPIARRVLDRLHREGAVPRVLAVTPGPGGA
jgi:hypothetical protein